MLQKRIVKIIFVMLCIGLATSLIANAVFLRKLSLEHQYIHDQYNQLLSSVHLADGGGFNFPGNQHASVDMTYAAEDLEDLYLHAMTYNQKDAQIIQQDAAFVSYVAMALIGDNTKYLIGPKGKTVVTMTPNQAKELVHEIFQTISKNEVDSDIPDDNINTVYNEVHNLIPQNFKSIDVFTNLYP